MDDDQAEAVARLEAAREHHERTVEAADGLRQQATSATEAALRDAVIEANRAGVPRYRLAEILGISRLTFSRRYTAVLDAEVDRTRTGPPAGGER